MESLCASIKHLPSNQAALDSIYDQFCALVDSQLLRKPTHSDSKRHPHKPLVGSLVRSRAVSAEKRSQKEISFLVKR